MAERRGGGREEEQELIKNKKSGKGAAGAADDWAQIDGGMERTIGGKEKEASLREETRRSGAGGMKEPHGVPVGLFVFCEIDPAPTPPSKNSRSSPGPESAGRGGPPPAAAPAVKMRRACILGPPRVLC